MINRGDTTLGLPVKLARRILSSSVITAVRSGIFIAAPYKNITFVSELKAALQAEGANVLHIELSVDPHTGPSLKISESVRKAILNDQKSIVRFIMQANASNTFPPSTPEHGGIGSALEIDLSAALAVLSKASSQLTVLIIEDVHLALSTPDGIATLFALKAARDELNSSKLNGLRVVCFSPYEKEIAILCREEGQAFFGAPMIKLPEG